MYGIGAATRRAEGRPRPGGDKGEADSTGGPRPARSGPGAWPTLVIEVGDSASLAGLGDNMGWWFRTSNHQVKMVLLAKFDHNRREIHVEKREEEPQATARPGAMTTRPVAAAIAAGALAPVHRRATTTIITKNATNPPTCNVGGTLVLSFGLLFLRDAGPGEGDFVISVPDPQFYAECVWPQVRDRTWGKYKQNSGCAEYSVGPAFQPRVHTDRKSVV